MTAAKPPNRPVKHQTRSGILGARIRQRRGELAMTQADLARRIGISASYLNLIEWNKRRIAGSLLRRIAEALDLSVEALEGAAEKRLSEALTEVSHLPALEALELEQGRVDELIGRFPGWARGVAALARSEQEAVRQVQTLSDRLSNDPFLGETVHRMLTRIAAIRSSVDILADYSDLPEDRRDRFTRIIQEESMVLSEVGEALAAYLDKAEETEAILTPLDEVEAFFDLHGNRFGPLDAAATALTPAVTDAVAVSRRDAARALAEDRMAPMIEDILDGQDVIRTAVARNRAQRALVVYAENAILMPMALFAARAAELGYDIEALADAFSVDEEAVCRRLTALPADREHPRFGYVSANAAGTVIEDLGLPGLAIPRYASACPLWVLYRAQQSPEAVIRQRALFPSGARFVFVARAGHTGPTGFGKPRHYVTHMIAMTEDDARKTVYAPDPSAPVDEVGPGCRLCPRRGCIHRVEDPLSE